MPIGNKDDDRRRTSQKFVNDELRNQNAESMSNDEFRAKHTPLQFFNRAVKSFISDGPIRFVFVYSPKNLCIGLNVFWGFLL